MPHPRLPLPVTHRRFRVSNLKAQPLKVYKYVLYLANSKIDQKI